jgi:hypothetical protein
MNENITFQRWCIAKKKINKYTLHNSKKDLWIEQHAAGGCLRKL